MAAVGAMTTAQEDLPVLFRALSDPVRAVRVQAGRVLRGLFPPGSAELSDYEAYLVLNEDGPQGAHEYATWCVMHGQDDHALVLFARAVAWDPASTLARRNFAVTLAGAGRLQEAVEILGSAPVLDEELSRLLEVGRSELRSATVE
jgi:hypothetical protein